MFRNCSQQSYLNQHTMRDFSDYIPPKPKGPFQLNDFAVVKNFIPAGVQTKSSAAHIGKLGTVIGYKNVPGSYSKYLLQFENGEKNAYMPSFLKGPFRSKETAQTYVDDPNKLIDPADIRTTAVVFKDWETNEKLEKKLKDVLTNNFFFTWLDEPVIVSSSSPNVVTFKLAELPGYPYFNLKRRHSENTRRLKGNDWSSRQATGYIANLPSTNSLRREEFLDKKSVTSVPIGELDGTQHTKYVLTDEYMKAYNQAVSRILKIRELETKLPELKGLF